MQVIILPSLKSIVHTVFNSKAIVKQIYSIKDFIFLGGAW